MRSGVAPLPGNTPTFLGSTSLWTKPECDLPRPRRREGGGGDRGRALPLASPQPRSAAPAWTGGPRLTGSVPDPRLLFGGSPPPAPTRVKPSAPRPRSREGQRGAGCLPGAEAGNGPHKSRGLPARSGDALASPGSPAKKAPCGAGAERLPRHSAARSEGGRRHPRRDAGSSQSLRPTNSETDRVLITISFKSKAFARVSKGVSRS